MKYKEVLRKIDELKKKEGKLISNLVSTRIEPDEEVEVLYSEKGIAFIIQEPYRKRAYFAVSDESELISLLQKIDSDVVLECIHRHEKENEIEPYILDSGFSFYKKYIRITICYNTNPYDVPAKGKRKLLQELYDSTCGEFAVLEDAQELYELTKKTFDPLTDDVFTLDEWRHIIQKKECMIYREQGEIIAYYVWRLEGKKLYGNISLNQGLANYLYNLERKVFETMWGKGIRVYYAWVNMKNRTALNRLFYEEAKKCIKSYSYIFNSIYIKK